MSHSLFTTGGSGYIGEQLIPILAKRGHELKALVAVWEEFMSSRDKVGTRQIPNCRASASLAQIEEWQAKRLPYNILQNQSASMLRMPAA